jgi:hypothetical protein
MKYGLAPLLCLLLAGPATALAQDEPVPASRPLDTHGRQQLLGEHKLGVQWIGWDDLAQAGSVNITGAGQVLAVSGSQVQGDKRLDIAGHITGLVEDGFVFEGAITLQGDDPARAQACVRSGRMHFTTRGIRQYWRLQQMTSPCGTGTDYVDIYFRGI